MARPCVRSFWEIFQWRSLQALAPSEGISIGTLMSHRKAFARWIYQHLEPEARDFLVLADRKGKSFLVSAMWPVVRDYMRSQHAEALSESQGLLQLANMTKPHTWYPLAAGAQQRIIYHAGPTNSGKTYNALQVRCAVAQVDLGYAYLCTHATAVPYMTAMPHYAATLQPTMLYAGQYHDVTPQH